MTDISESNPCPIKRAFFIVGPTAAGKSALAADIAKTIDAEVVNADAFQIYHGFDVLSGKPDPGTQANVPHHLLGTVPTGEEMNAEKFREAAVRAVTDIQSRGKTALVVGGSGLYLKALTHGLSRIPAANPQLRHELNSLSLEELRTRLEVADPEGAKQIDLKNRRRVVRALEICLLTGRPASEQRRRWKTAAGAADSDSQSNIAVTDSGPKSSSPSEGAGVLVFRDREELHQRINQRVEMMLRKGAIDEVNNCGKIGATAGKMIGFREIRSYLDGNCSLAECTAAIQQATRQYAKRQLTWFRGQLNFEPLNLSLLSHSEAVEWISRRALACRAGE